MHQSTKRRTLRRPIAQAAAAAAGQKQDREEYRIVTGGALAMAQGFKQQQIECTPLSLIRSLSGNLVQGEGGQSARREQVPIALQPCERVPPVRFAAYGRPLL